MKAFLLVLSRDVLLCTVVPTVSIDRWLREGIACWKSWGGTWCRFTQLHYIMKGMTVTVSRMSHSIIVQEDPYGLMFLQFCICPA